MGLLDLLMKRALFPGKTTANGVMAAIWNPSSKYDGEEAVRFSEYSPTMDELSRGLMFISAGTGYVPFSMDGSMAKVEEIEDSGGTLMIMVQYSMPNESGEHVTEWVPLFLVAPKEAGEEAGIYRNLAINTDYTDNPIIIVW